MIAARIEKMIPDATGFLSILIMVCVFMLSFANLQTEAVKAVSPPGWPGVARECGCSSDCRERDDSSVIASERIYLVRMGGGNRIHRGGCNILSPIVREISSDRQRISRKVSRVIVDDQGEIGIISRADTEELLSKIELQPVQPSGFVDLSISAKGMKVLIPVEGPD